jgi:glutaredoxin
MGFVLEKFPGAKTFPQIIVEGNHVGGYDNFSAFLEQKNK